MKHPANYQARISGQGLAEFQPTKRIAGFQSGLSLIELMISITIGLLILVSLSTLFINQSKTRSELDKSNRMIDNGRYAMELISGNLRLAGFYDNFSTSGAPTTLYDPCDAAAITDATKNLDVLRVPAGGYDAASPTSLITSPPCAAAYNTTGNASYCSPSYTTTNNCTLKAGSDILVVRRASTNIVQAANAVNTTTYLQVSMCSTDTAAPPNNYQIVTAPASFGSTHKLDCATSAHLRQFMVTTYFVSPNNNVTGGVGDGIPTLKQIDQFGNVTPLVEGIEYLQVDYGVDDNGDGTPDRYISCAACTLADFSNIVSAKINILARNQNPTTGWNENKTYSLGDTFGTVTPPSNDSYKRHAFTQLVRLVNPAGRRETP